jgi:undecaprenyl-diphosphatase
MTLARARTALSAPDYKLMRRLNRWRAPRWFRWWMLLATRAGDGWLWGLVGIALLASSPDRLRFRAIEAAGCAVTAGILLFQHAKRVFRRVRPSDIEPHCWARIVTRDRFSFPSGHSTIAFAVAVSIGSFYPETRPLLVALAANVAISRVIVGMHFFSDVVVGSAMGAGIGYAAFAAFRFAA